MPRSGTLGGAAGRRPAHVQDGAGREPPWIGLAVARPDTLKRQHHETSLRIDAGRGCTQRFTGAPLDGGADHALDRGQWRFGLLRGGFGREAHHEQDRVTIGPGARSLRRLSVDCRMDIGERLRCDLADSLGLGGFCGYVPHVISLSSRRQVRCAP